VDDSAIAASGTSANAPTTLLLTDRALNPSSMRSLLPHLRPPWIPDGIAVARLFFAQRDVGGDTSKRNEEMQLTGELWKLRTSAVVCVNDPAARQANFHSTTAENLRRGTMQNTAQGNG
jgi:hypothetical protein